MDSRRRRGWVPGVWEGRRDVTHARGTVNASAIRQMHETPPHPTPPPVFRAHQISPTTLLYLSNRLPSPLPPGACMQSANVKCNICLSTYLHSSTRIPLPTRSPPCPPPAPLATDEPSLGFSLSIAGSRSRFSAFLPAFYPTPRWAGARLCIYRMCMNFIDSCQSLVSGREGWRELARGQGGGKKRTTRGDARDCTVDVH